MFVRVIDVAPVYMVVILNKKCINVYLKNLLMHKNNISLIKIRSNPLSMWIKTQPRNVKLNPLHELRKILNNHTWSVKDKTIN
jgi:hypothetical protein